MADKKDLTIVQTENGWIVYNRGTFDTFPRGPQLEKTHSFESLDNMLAFIEAEYAPEPQPAPPLQVKTGWEVDKNGKVRQWITIPFYVNPGQTIVLGHESELISSATFRVGKGG